MNTTSEEQGIKVCVNTMPKREDIKWSPHEKIVQCSEKIENTLIKDHISDYIGLYLQVKY